VLDDKAKPDETERDGGRGAGFGRVHVLTGDGRGKTTSAFGLASRAWGTGARVLFVQFVKSARGTGEEAAAAALGERFRFEALGAGFVRGEPTDADRAASAEALTRVEEAVASGQFDMVVADEILVAVSLGLVARAGVERIVVAARGRVELVLTGRGAPEWLRDLADYWTELRAVKHPYSDGTPARRGIEY
jgi:cob(I)alamin adenosyltransferase